MSNIEYELRVMKCVKCGGKQNFEPVKPGQGFVVFQCLECDSQVTLNAYTGSVMRGI